MDKVVNITYQEKDLEKFQCNLLEWGEMNFREFPWRVDRHPYRVLISEVMLHRTQARQVLPIYEKFINHYPNIDTLHLASKEELFKELHSLGLVWRIDLLFEMTKIIVENYSGKVPKDRENLLQLPGVSDYIASAVRCFSWNYAEPIADTNTIRIVGRLFGINTSSSSRRNAKFHFLLSAILSGSKPRKFNYALLDFADAICTIKSPPQCNNCPVVRYCKYGNNIIGPSVHV